jgi:predicted nucleic acid-binding protein
MIILDTNVLSEFMKKGPSERVVAWMNEQRREELFCTAITQSEIFYGIALLDPSPRKDALSKAAHALFEEDFEGRILSFDSHSAVHYATIAAERRRAGRPITTEDAQIGAIARTHHAQLATRNVSDFEGCALSLVNPWD